MLVRRLRDVRGGDFVEENSKPGNFDFIWGGGCGHKMSPRVLKKLGFTAPGVNRKAVFYQEDFQEPKSNSGSLSMPKHPIYTLI